jgi:predicted SAM-dependent methyltransferase
MIKYFAAAVGLRAFSLNSITRAGYRRLGNIVGQKKRQHQNIDKYIERGNLLVDIAKKYGVLKDGVSLVELGTGWIHWFGLYLRLHVNGRVKLELYDVWDNRQLDALRDAFRELKNRWMNNASVSESQRNQLDSIINARTFEDLYKKVGANYTIDSNGLLKPYRDESYDAVFSFHVLEHVGRDSIEDSIGDMYRMLKPGGYCIHQIGIDDHLSHYDSKESKKNYLRYSRALRKCIFENVVQYHNVLQGEDFLRFFQSSGFDIVEVDRERCDLDALSIHPDWKGYSREDLETTLLTVVCRKPA